MLLGIVDIAPLVLLGLLAGTWGVLIGAGGGFVIVPLLLFFKQELEVFQVTGISLMAVMANGFSGAVAYWRLGRIDYKSGLAFIAAALPGSVIGAIVVNFIPRDAFQLVLGLLLLAVAIYTIFKPFRPSGGVRGNVNGMPRLIRDSLGNVYEYKIRLKAGMGITFFVGFLASMLGVGGGIFNVPAFVFLLGMPVQVATATSQFMLGIVSLGANITNLLQGDVSGYWTMIIALSGGTILGAQLGAWISRRLSSALIIRFLAIGLALVGARLVL